MNVINRYKNYMNKKRIEYNNGKHHFGCWFLVNFVGLIIAIMLTLNGSTKSFGEGLWFLAIMSFTDFFVGIFFQKGLIYY